MHELLNTLYITTQGALLRCEHDTVRITHEGATLARLPLRRIQAITVFGNVTLTTPLIHQCALDGRSISWHTETGRYRAQITGPTTGNVLLRRAQHHTLDNPTHTQNIARQMIAGKIQNARRLILRTARDATTTAAAATLRDTAQALADALGDLRTASGMDTLRGIEGIAARRYFAVFDTMIKASEDFTFDGRTRRPPRDRPNALLSFCYALLRGDCAAALEGVGLDPQVGYLHALRPGRPALALDLMEELRSAVADRLALRLINRRQIQTSHFEATPGGAVRLTEDGRRVFLRAYQHRKAETVTHPLLKQSVPVGLLPHIQARLLARHLRGDLAHYIPFTSR